jgi:PAS domain S-box-containing protein
VALLVGLLLLVTVMAIALALEFQRRFHAATTRLLTIARDPLRRYDRARARAMDTIAFAEFEAVAQILTANAGIHQQLIAELSESAKRYHATLFALSEGVVTHGRDGKITACNPAAERILGLSAAQLMGVKDPDPGRHYVHEDGTPFPLETHPSAQVLRTGLAQPNVVMGIVTSDGVPTWILVNAMPMFNPGEPLPAFVVVSFSDITQRRNAEARLEVKREKLAAVFENSAVGFILSDAQGRRVSMNATALALIGYPHKEDMQGSAQDAMGNWGLHNGDGRPLLFDEWPLVRAVRGEFVRNLELHGSNTSNGKAWVCKLTTAPVSDPSGKVNFILQTLFDITKTKRLEQALLVRNADLQNATKLAEKATKAAEKASLAKSNFLSSMSHELRTPLNAILGFAQLMETSAPPPTPAQKRSIDQILSAGWHLLELVNDILDLAQIESGKDAMACEAVSLEQVLSRCQAMVEPLAHKRGIGMRFPRLDPPLFVEGDPTRIKQVLINLVYNAVKYNRPDGRVTVECTLASPHSIRISVHDTGVGLTAEQLSQLFQPFNRLGQEAGPVTGTGVGLVVSKRLVERMGGSIGADSTVGVGSVFWIELPLTIAPPQAVVSAPPAAPAEPLSRESTVPKTVLYVEDNPANLELVEALMARRLDLRLITAGDGNLGVEYARSYLPEVILMDLHLPGISGIEAMSQLQADALTADIPVIALSAYALPGDIEKAMKAGFVSYLTKPIVLNEFMAALNVALESSHRKSTRRVPLPETSDH